MKWPLLLTLLELAALGCHAGETHFGGIGSFEQSTARPGVPDAWMPTSKLAARQNSGRDDHRDGQWARSQERTNLLVFPDNLGVLRPVKSKRDWQKRRAEILRRMQVVMGPLPGQEKRCPLDARVEEEVDCGTYVRRFLTYASEPDGRVPAYLLIPKPALAGRRRVPAVLCLHPTDAQLGHKVIVGLGGPPNRAYAKELAERGYVTLAPAYPRLANYQPDLPALGYDSGTMKAIWNNIRGLDLLESLPFVRRGRFGAIGHSLGGHNAIFTAVFDPRLKVVVSSCGFDSFRDYMDGDLRGWTSERYMPRLLAYRDRVAEVPFDFDELLAALAPRVCWVSAPLGDTNFKWRSVDAMVRAAAPVYRLYRVPQNLRVAHPDCGHDFPDEMREAAYRLFDKNLR